MEVKVSRCYIHFKDENTHTELPFHFLSHLTASTASSPSQNGLSVVIIPSFLSPKAVEIYLLFHFRPTLISLVVCLFLPLTLSLQALSSCTRKVKREDKFPQTIRRPKSRKGTLGWTTLHLHASKGARGNPLSRKSEGEKSQARCWDERKSLITSFPFSPHWFFFPALMTNN